MSSVLVACGIKWQDEELVRDRARKGVLLELLSAMRCVDGCAVCAWLRALPSGARLSSYSALVAV